MSTTTRLITAAVCVLAAVLLSAENVDTAAAAAAATTNDKSFHLNDTDAVMMIQYLYDYGYLKKSIDTDSIESWLHNDNNEARHNRELLRRALALLQEFYRISGKGELTDETVHLMRRPRCGLPDITENAMSLPRRAWPTRHITWNFQLATEDLLTTARAAFDVWTKNTSLTFERDTLNPNILISFREGTHMMADRTGIVCTALLDGPGGALAHAFYPTGSPNFVSEIHVDKAEAWHIKLSAMFKNKHSLYYVLIHEIGHALGLVHNNRKNSVMFPFMPAAVALPVNLHLEDILNIRELYKTIKMNEDHPTNVPTTPTTTTPAAPRRRTTTTATTDVVPTRNGDATDLCALRDADSILIMDKRIYIARERQIWSVDIFGKTYNGPIAITEYLRFLPANFTRLTAAYRTSAGEIVLFTDNTVYTVKGFDYEIATKQSYGDFGLPSNAKVNVAINTHSGRNFVIYNDYIAGEVGDCSANRIIRHHNIQSIFPGIPHGVTMAFRYIDGHLYFIVNQQYYRYNEFTETVVSAGEFDLRIVGIMCPRDGLLRQLRDLLRRITGDRRKTTNITDDDDACHQE